MIKKLLYFLAKLFNIRVNSKDIELIKKVYIDYLIASESGAIYNQKIPTHKFMSLGICHYTYITYRTRIYNSIISYNKIQKKETFWCKGGNIQERLPLIKELIKYLEENKQFKIIDK